jgi:hypothetical protein
MLSAQYLASCLRRCHPSHEVIQFPPGPRKNCHGRPLKETLSSRFRELIEHHLVDDIAGLDLGMGFRGCSPGPPQKRGPPQMKPVQWQTPTRVPKVKKASTQSKLVLMKDKKMLFPRIYSIAS